MLADTRAASALDTADCDAIVDLLVRIGRLADDHPEIAELDLNPVIVADGTARVADVTLLVQAAVRPERPFRRLESD